MRARFRFSLFLSSVW
uniref:Uncharacterized protein n=1 Tax=Arundo donax TaxID=35708 RepID=A0A0A8ZQR3_ARUDO